MLLLYVGGGGAKSYFLTSPWSPLSTRFADAVVVVVADVAQVGFRLRRSKCS